MINVWCVCVGDKYTDEDVFLLKSMVARHLDELHDFYVLADRQIADFNCFIPDEKWPGWWSKLLLFRYAGGQVLYLDLDVVVVGDLLPLVSRQLSMPANWAQSGHGGCQSSVMSWHSQYERLEHIADLFDHRLLGPADGKHYGLYGPSRLWGDQEYITAMMGEPGNGVNPMAHVYSYKYHCTKGLPDDASVVCFHGRPKPAEVKDRWVAKARQYTATPT